MSSTTTHTPFQPNHLPPSPPPSPPLTRRRHKKRTDSFEKLANTPLPSRSNSPAQDTAEETGDSLITRIILTPLLFISFILSLSLVNLRDRAYRTYAHSSASFLAYLDPQLEPYQDPDDSRWDRRDQAGHVQPSDAISPKQGKKTKERPWHLNKKIRKVVRMEVSDAFEMRGKVMAGMMGGIVLGLAALGWAGYWMLMACWR